MKLRWVAASSLGLCAFLFAWRAAVSLSRHDLRPSFGDASPPANTYGREEASVSEDQTPEIRGRILDADGNPVEAATLRLVSASPPYSVYRDGKTERDGSFSFAHVGPFHVRVVAEHGLDGVVTSAVVRAGEGQTLELTLVLSAAGAVSGTVVDRENKPVAGANVSVDGVPWIVRAASDSVGAFRLTTVPDEATSLIAIARGYRTAHVPLGPRSDQSELVIRIVLTPANAVGGVVRDEDGNTAVADVVACENQESEARTQSAADGTFSLPASAIGCDAVAERAESAPSDPAPVVEGGHLVLRLKAGGGIEGAVVDEQGAAIPAFVLGIESFVPARGRGAGRRDTRNINDAGGAFRWDKLSPGSYVLTASAEGRPPARSASIDVRAGVVTRGVRIVAGRGGTVVGRVYDEGRAAIAGADLRFDAVSRVAESNAAARTDELGNYRLEGAPSGPFTIRIHKDGFRMKLISGLRADSGNTLQEDITLVLVDGGATMEFGGIGAGLVQTPSGIAFQNIFPGDPAAQAGLRAGDVVMQIDGESVDNLSMADALQRIRGEPGTSVGVSVRRPETGETVDLTIVRGRVVH